MSDGRLISGMRQSWRGRHNDVTMPVSFDSALDPRKFTTQ